MRLIIYKNSNALVAGKEKQPHCIRKNIPEWKKVFGNLTEMLDKLGLSDIITPSNALAAEKKSNHTVSWKTMLKSK